MADPGTVPRVLIDRYELRDLAGVGGMGEVWMGWDRRLQRDVAVKLLLPQLSDEPSFRERFLVEARAAAALDHPNVVRVYDIDEDQGALFIVMERLPGPSLDQVIAEHGPLSEDDVRRVAADMLAALAAAHAENLVHRDIKPGNLIKGPGGRWKVGDFGVAKDLASTAHLTLVGVAVGTPAYLAPEQLDGSPATPATDLWAAAVVLREALTGRRPFEGNDPIQVAHAVQSTVVPPLASLRPDVSPALAGALDRGLSRDPRLRFATARALSDAVEGKGESLPVVPAPPPSVSGEVAALPSAGATPGGALLDAGPGAALASPAPAGAFPETPVGTTGAAGSEEESTARRVGVVAVVAGTIVLLFLVGVIVALALVALSGGSDDEGQEATVASEDTAGDDGDGNAQAAPDGSGDESEDEAPPTSMLDSPSTTTSPAPDLGEDPDSAGIYELDDPDTNGDGFVDDGDAQEFVDRDGDGYDDRDVNEDDFIDEYDYGSFIDLDGDGYDDRDADQDEVVDEDEGLAIPREPAGKMGAFSSGG